MYSSIIILFIFIFISNIPSGFQQNDDCVCINPVEVLDCSTFYDCADCIDNGCSWCGIECIPARNACRIPSLKKTSRDQCCSIRDSCETCLTQPDCLYCRLYVYCAERLDTKCTEFSDTCECPNNCSGNGECDTGFLACDCNTGYAGNDCSDADFLGYYVVSWMAGPLLFSLLMFTLIKETISKFKAYNKTLDTIDAARGNANE